MTYQSLPFKVLCREAFSCLEEMRQKGEQVDLVVSSLGLLGVVVLVLAVVVLVGVVGVVGVVMVVVVVVVVVVLVLLVVVVGELINLGWAYQSLGVMGVCRCRVMGGPGWPVTGWCWQLGHPTSGLCLELR